jgi:hypothetical protein
MKRLKIVCFGNLCAFCACSRPGLLFGYRTLALAFLLVAALPAPAQFTISGVTDRAYSSYSDSVTFTITPQSGYTYYAALDTNRVPVGVPVTVNQVDYHELRVAATNISTGSVTNALVRFILQASARGTTENGLPPWTPWPVVNSASNEFANAHLRLIAPANFPLGYDIPIVAWVENDQGHAVRANGLLSAPDQPAIQIKRGAGSGFLTAATNAGALIYDPLLAQMADPKAIAIDNSTTWTYVSGTLGGNATWPENSRIAITNTLTIPAGVTLTVGPASIVRLSPAVNVYLNGALVINGATNQPVVFMPVNRSQPWGGFFLSSGTSGITASGAIFTGSGSGPSGGAGHRSEQCLFFCTNYANINLTDSAAISLAGQLGHSFSMSGAARYFFTYNHFLMQGAVTSGEYTDAVFNVNDSAFIDFYKAPPPFQTFNDGDEDAIYIVNIPTGYASGFTNTLIGWTRDDGVDSGGNGAGVLNFKNCWFESIYHEGNSLSGTQSSSAHADKFVTHADDVFLGVGQGVENGYGAVTNRVAHCLMVGNRVGVRFGDNYNWTYYGFTYATNSILINNYHDVWGMTWQTDTSGAYTGWVWRTNEMDIRSNFLSAPNPYHPANTLWNPPTDGWRLASFMSTPPDASVGVGFVTWTNQFAMASLFDGAPVGLSGFTTNYVSVDYAFLDASNATLASGTLAFAPGETVKRIYPAGFDLSAKSQVQVTLTNAVHGELTGTTNLLFTGSVAMPLVACWLNTNQLETARVTEGVPLKLSGPSAQAVSVGYNFESGSGVLLAGNAVFTPGETVKWIAPPSPVPTNEPLVCFSLSNPAWAQLGSRTNVYFIKSIASSNPPPVTLIPTNATWRYLDNGVDQGTNWMKATNSDASWSSGAAKFGFNGSGNSGITTVLGYGNASDKYRTYYFRRQFVVNSTADISSLYVEVQRDDGVAMYLNGQPFYRDNLPAGVLTYVTFATNAADNGANFQTATLPATGLVAGTNLLAAEVHQSSTNSSDLVFEMRLTANLVLPSAPSLGHAVLSGQLVLYWDATGYTLQEALDLDGPWSPVSGATSPQPMALTGDRRFFRLSKP